MNVKTCLLISDDPDDHQAFTEAIARLSDEIVVLIVVNSEKALALIASGTHVPDYVLIDLSIVEQDAEIFVRQFSSTTRPILLYGQPDQLAELNAHRFLTLLPKEYEYSTLLNVLRDFIRSAQEL